MEHKFKVGDKVKVHYLTGNRIGYIQERKSELRYDIRYDEGCIGHDIAENRIVKYNGNQDMEIKVGDKVRVSKDAPKLYTRYATMVCGVNNVEDGIAVISPTDNPMVKCVIPLKYLTKVNAEAKEPKPKYKAGDKVRVLGHALLEGGVFTITLVEHREKRGWMYRINTHTWYPESDLDPYTEPTEDKIDISAPESVEYLRIASEESHLRNFSQNIANCDKWDTYTADLAKEIALKVANKKMDNDPKEAADYAVSVAKAVVENLKKK